MVLIGSYEVGQGGGAFTLPQFEEKILAAIERYVLYNNDHY